MLDLVLMVYWIGVIISAYQSMCDWMLYQRAKNEVGFDVFRARPDMISFLIMRIFIWPYYVFLCKNPIEFVSRCFFSHYGDPGHTYFGTLGIRNCLNDLIKGRNRYQGCQPKIAIFSLD